MFLAKLALANKCYKLSPLACQVRTAGVEVMNHWHWFGAIQSELTSPSARRVNNSSSASLACKSPAKPRPLTGPPAPGSARNPQLNVEGSGLLIAPIGWPGSSLADRCGMVTDWRRLENNRGGGARSSGRAEVGKKKRLKQGRNQSQDARETTGRSSHPGESGAGL